jgi:hypothetical protein
LAPAVLSNGKNVFEELGTGFTLLALGSSSTDTQVLIDAAATAGLPLTVVQEASGQEADRYEARWVLVRPDQFVAWVSDEPTISAENAQELFKRMRGNSDHAAH